MKQSTINSDYYYKTKQTIKSQIEIYAIIDNENLSTNVKNILIMACKLMYSICDKDGKQIFNDIDSMIEQMEDEIFFKLSKEYSDLIKSDGK